MPHCVTLASPLIGQRPVYVVLIGDIGVFYNGHHFVKAVLNLCAPMMSFLQLCIHVMRTPPRKRRRSSILSWSFWFVDCDWLDFDCLILTLISKGLLYPRVVCVFCECLLWKIELDWSWTRQAPSIMAPMSVTRNMISFTEDEQEMANWFRRKVKDLLQHLVMYWVVK